MRHETPPDSGQAAKRDSLRVLELGTGSTARCGVKFA